MNPNQQYKFITHLPIQNTQSQRSDNTLRQSLGPQLTLYKSHKEQPNSEQSLEHQLITKIFLLTIQINRLHEIVERLMIGQKNKNDWFDKQIGILMNETRQMRLAMQRMDRQRVKKSQEYRQKIEEDERKLNEVEINRRNLQWRINDLEAMIEEFKKQNADKEMQLQKTKVQEQKIKLMNLVNNNQQVRITINRQKEAEIQRLKYQNNNFQSIIHSHKSLIASLSVQNQQLRKRQVKLVESIQKQMSKSISHHQYVHQAINTEQHMFKTPNYQIKEQINNGITQLNKKDKEIYQLRQKTSFLQLKIEEIKINSNNQLSLMTKDIKRLEAQINKNKRESQRLQKASKRDKQQHIIEIQMLNNTISQLKLRIRINQSQLERKQREIMQISNKKHTNSEKEKNKQQQKVMKYVGMQNSHLNINVKQHELELQRIIQSMVEIQNSNNKVQRLIGVLKNRKDHSHHEHTI